MSDFWLVLKIALVVIIATAFIVLMVGIPLMIFNRIHRRRFQQLYDELSFTEKFLPRPGIALRLPWIAGTVNGLHTIVLTGAYYAVMRNIPGLNISSTRRQGITAVRMKTQTRRFREFQIIPRKRVSAAVAEDPSSAVFYDYFQIKADGKDFTQPVSAELKEKLFRFSRNYGRSNTYIWMDNEGYLLIPLSDWMISRKKYQRTIDAIHLLQAFN